MNWGALKDKVGKYTPLLGRLLGGPAGQVVGEIVASALGVEADPEAVANAMATNTNVKLQLQNAEARHKEKLLELSILHEQAVVTNEIKATIEVNKTMQAELQSEHWYYRSWRPSFGYSVALVFIINMLTPAVMIWYFPERLPAYVEFLTSTVVVWSFAFGVLGVYVHKRSQDKIVRSGRNPKHTLEQIEKLF